MSDAPFQRDLVVLTADKDAEFAVRGILSRYQSLGIRPVQADFYRHPEKDPGVLLHAHTFLQPFATTHAHALVIMDLEGCGQESTGRASLEKRIEMNLGARGWEGRAVAVIPDPELEIWVWSGSPNVERVLGWQGHAPPLRAWLESHGHTQAGIAKPCRPKEALQNALRATHIPWSADIFEQLARSVSLAKCQDDAFLKLRNTIQAWFGTEQQK